MSDGHGSATDHLPSGLASRARGFRDGGLHVRGHGSGMTHRVVPPLGWRAGHATGTPAFCARGNVSALLFRGGERPPTERGEETGNLRGKPVMAMNWIEGSGESNG